MHYVNKKLDDVTERGEDELNTISRLAVVTTVTLDSAAVRVLQYYWQTMQLEYVSLFMAGFPGLFFRNKVYKNR